MDKMKPDNNTTDITAPDIASEVKKIIEQARMSIAVTVNRELLSAYWQIGKLISTRTQTGDFDTLSDRAFMLALSKTLTNEFGRGFSRPNLINMKKLYESYPDGQTLSDHLSWSHYCELLSVSDTDARSFYEKECLNSRWSVRELSRQIDSALFERLLLADGNQNKQKLIELARDGQVIDKPADIMKDPYVLEFLGLQSHKPEKEKGLENAGQMNGYVNYYKTEVNAPDDNPPIGIILCADKDAVVAEFALGGLENHIFASKYTLLLPDKEQLIKQVEYVLAQDENDADNENDENRIGQEGQDGQHSR